MQDDKGPILTQEVRDWYAALGRRGGPGRAKVLSAKRRSEIARMGAEATNKLKRKKRRTA